MMTNMNDSPSHPYKFKECLERISNGVRFLKRDRNALRSHAITFDHLGKLGPINSVHVHDLITCFDRVIDGIQSAFKTRSEKIPEVASNACDVQPTPSCTILGLAESGIIPSFAVKIACEQRGIRCNWSCSSRINTGGLTFNEPHSHAPKHFLSPDLLHNIGHELWVVEDEITTGRTLQNLLERVYDLSGIRRCRIFTLMDAMRFYDLVRFRTFCRRQGWCVSIHSVIRSFNARTESRVSVSSNHPNDLNRHYAIGEAIASALPALLSGKIKQIHQVTLSPWVVDGRHIRSRHDFGEGYFLYNASVNEPMQIWEPHV